MRQRILTLLIAVLCLTVLSAGAEGFDVSAYSYEELAEIREMINLRMAEIERENALLNADRNIVFVQKEATIYLGGKTSQEATVISLKQSAPETTELTWSSSNPDIASTDGSGMVTAVSAGDAVITAAAADNPYISGSYTVHVQIPVERITLWGSNEPILLQGSDGSAAETLGYSIEPEDAGCQEIRWSSSDETVAAVDEAGRITGRRAGTATITATSAENPPAGGTPVRATYEVTVLQPVTGIELSEPELTLNVGQKVQPEAVTIPEDASNPALSYASENPEIATVDGNGVITALAKGECDITCTAEDGSGTASAWHVTVVRMVTKIEMPEDGIRLAAGATKQIEPVIFPEDATNRKLIWTSSNVFVARAANGRIEAVGQGECEITCAAADGSGVTATIQVRVPTFSVPQDEYTVTEKSGIVIPVQTGKQGTQLELRCETKCFEADWNENGDLQILPLSAGKGKVILTNPDEETDTTEILITIEDSAVFNQVSYPTVPYDELTLNPESYEGLPISLYGKVLQWTREENRTIFLTVGTGGKQYTDQVFQVRLPLKSIMDIPEEGTMATFYGLFRTEKIFSEALGSEILVPGLETEKIEVSGE